MKPDISVVIPLYNKERYIRRTLDSVLRQTFGNFELIIVDSSDDGSTEIVRTYSDPRIRHIIREKRTYLPISRNVGAARAEADLIAFIDADDEWMPGHLEALHALAEEFPDAGVYTTPYIKVRPSGAPAVMIFAEIPRPPWHGYIRHYFRACSRGDVPVCSSSSAVKKSIFHEMQGFDEILIHGGEDQHFWGRIALHYPVAFTWMGPAIYHTEAEGRMCNAPHRFTGDPLSAHLEELLAQGAIPVNLIPEVKAYCRRRQKTVWVLRLLGRTRSEPGTPAGGARPDPSFVKSVGGRLVSVPEKGLRIFLDSRLYDTCRKAWCLVHGWYIPRLITDEEIRQERLKV
jgi:glycosyltransferase involved in cell wall biosynthesis